MRLLILPGWQNSGPEHWQSLWQASMADAQRVEQADWDDPQCRDWVANLSAAVNASKDDVILVAHSLGCALTAWWVALGMPGVLVPDKVIGALLVAPPDVERPDMPTPSFAPMPTTRLPFASIVLASDNDPWCELPRAQAWAQAWGAEFHCLGALGHINTATGLGRWTAGQDWLSELKSRTGPR